MHSGRRNTDIPRCTPAAAAWRRRWLVICLLGPALAACAFCAVAQQTRVLGFDAKHCSASFRVHVFWFRTVSGRFSDVHGNVRIDPASHRARIWATIRVGSVQVHPAHYRHRLLGKQFFDAESWPYIRFTSAPLDLAELRTGSSLKGKLSLHGMTRPWTLRVSHMQCPTHGYSGCTLSLRGRLNRTHFDMRAHRLMVSSRVYLKLVIRLVSVPQETARG